ncbi:sigma-70 family RNA polymerase sigma factor [uncultured Sanguibacteroides sp.]|uniref:sigma-70 family RNA polymerase sigma factor n=1 Tax=uncultured Sanguibacteroides sp. TaxID=1635151 RepID=UPI0025E16EA7|nr:sigma-70 family RNA polymerase sigma factor [uncultured Sanguibacteroides sp.]
MGVGIRSHREFEHFFREFYPSVYTFMRRYTEDGELAADLTQEAFVRVYERRDEIESIDYAKAFLYTIARHLYWNHCRHLQVAENYRTQWDEEEDYGILKEITRQETIRILYAAINKLAPQTRRIILLNLEGKNNAEVAEELHISVNTVKCLKKSAYVTLRGLLSKDYMVLLMLLLME